MMVVINDVSICMETFCGGERTHIVMRHWFDRPGVNIRHRTGTEAPLTNHSMGNEPYTNKGLFARQGHLEAVSGRGNPFGTGCGWKVISRGMPRSHPAAVPAVRCARIRGAHPARFLRPARRPVQRPGTRCRRPHWCWRLNLLPDRHGI